MRVIKTYLLLLALLIALSASGCKGGVSPTDPGPYAAGGDHTPEACVEIDGARDGRCP
jgi:hypothetical protein